MQARCGARRCYPRTPLEPGPSLERAGAKLPRLQTRAALTPGSSPGYPGGQSLNNQSRFDVHAGIVRSRSVFRGSPLRSGLVRASTLLRCSSVGGIVPAVGSGRLGKPHGRGWSVGSRESRGSRRSRQARTLCRSRGSGVPASVIAGVGDLRGRSGGCGAVWCFRTRLGRSGTSCEAVGTAGVVGPSVCTPVVVAGRARGVQPQAAGQRCHTPSSALDSLPECA